MSPKLSVIIPMYNEQENVVNTLKKVSDVLYSMNIDYELIIVNDGSTDNTLDLLKKEAEKYKRLRIITYEKNRNLGGALKIGFEKAKGDHIITIDSDLSYDAKFIADLYHEAERSNYDIIQGSPYMKGGSALGIPPLRLIISKRKRNIKIPASVKKSIFRIFLFIIFRKTNCIFQNAWYFFNYFSFDLFRN